ncbi:hypothetical protein ACFL24_00360 [Patescibacteria group bacterium]
MIFHTVRRSDWKIHYFRIMKHKKNASYRAILIFDTPEDLENFVLRLTPDAQFFLRVKGEAVENFVLGVDDITIIRKKQKIILFCDSAFYNEKIQGLPKTCLIDFKRRECLDLDNDIVWHNQPTTSFAQ